MKNLGYLVSFVLIVSLAVVLSACKTNIAGQAGNQTMPENIQCDTTSCSTNDEGYNPFLKGTDNFYVFNDTCTQQTRTDFCVNNTALIEYINCRSSVLIRCSCIDGACICNGTCFTNDGGDNIYLRGIDTYRRTINNTCMEVSVSDYCANNLNLLEYVNCRSNLTKYCLYSCVDGACVNSSASNSILNISSVPLGARVYYRDYYGENKTQIYAGLTPVKIVVSNPHYKNASKNESSTSYYGYKYFVNVTYGSQATFGFFDVLPNRTFTKGFVFRAENQTTPPANQTNETIPCNTTYCSTTDGGDNIYVKGTDISYGILMVNYTNSCVKIEHSDYCTNNSTAVFEYINCTSSRTANCQYGCSNGACVGNMT